MTRASEYKMIFLYDFQTEGYSVQLVDKHNNVVVEVNKLPGLCSFQALHIRTENIELLHMNNSKFGIIAGPYNFTPDGELLVTFVDGNKVATKGVKSETGESVVYALSTEIMGSKELTKELFGMY